MHKYFFQLISLKIIYQNLLFILAMSVHRNDLGTGMFSFSVKITSSTSKYPRKMSFESGIQVDLKAVQNFQNNKKSGSYGTDFRSASLIVLDLKLLLLWHLFVSVLILIELQRKSGKSYYKIRYGIPIVDADNRHSQHVLGMSIV